MTIPVRPGPLPPAAETGTLGIYSLKRLWARQGAGLQGQTIASNLHDRQLDYLVIHACGLGLDQTLDFLSREQPSLDVFERWIVAPTGGVDPLRVTRINAAVIGAPYPTSITQWLAEIEASAPVLTADDFTFWDKHGYVVLHDAVPHESLAAA